MSDITTREQITTAIIFFQAILYVLLPMGIISTALATSVREGDLKRSKVFLVVLSGSIAYGIAHILMENMKDDSFNCNIGWCFFYKDQPFNLTLRAGFDDELSNPRLWLAIGS